MSIESCYGDISNYNNIKTNLKQVVNNLNSSCSDISPVGNNIASEYKINGEPTDISDKCDNLKEDIKNTSNYINNVIIPALDKGISDTKDDIEDLEEKEKEEKEKNEE